MKTIIFLPFLIVLAACGESSHSALDANRASKTFELKCRSDNAAAGTRVTIVEADSAFDVKATSGDTVIFNVPRQRPSLNARIEDGPSEVVREFVDFKDKGLEVIPVDGPKKLEIDLGQGSTQLTC